ncbi:hypothetical protein L1987_09267 [Smallanthus sonchifolius]|uniref:Uncharacterized protein n=1 Tax=Smallanthus sonchifolius TaxID=185202 RepID=A0ACB9JPB5_9ASTR|nr:hypothetical protein L1987_09267 [Smallanthus sonchifolius]
MAVSSPSLQGNFYAASSKFSFVRSDWCKWRTFRCKKRGSAWIIRSVMNNKESSINGDEAIEPTRILLERLFTQTQKLEEKIGKDLNLPQDIRLELNLGTLESDLQAALTVLRKRVEDLEDAENKLLSEYRELTQAKEELGKQEEVIKHMFLKQEKLENELKQANLELAFQATEIENLKLQLEKQDKEITAAQSALVLKQNEIDVMVNELRLKTEEDANAESELRSKSQLLVKTKEILNKQTLESEELRKTVEEKDEELQIATTLLEIEEENLKVVEGNLEKQTMDWLLAQEEMKNLADDASKHTVEGDENLQEFSRVKKLLADVRLELVSSQKSLASSRKEMEDQQEVLEKELLELEQHRESLIAYAKSLGDAEVEVESERVKLRLAEARNQELKRDLLIEKDVIKELQNQLDAEKHSLLQATEEMSVLRDELDRKKSEYESMRNTLESKESQLVEAKLEIQHLKSKQALLELMLKEKESELSQAQEMLSEVNQEILNLKMLLSSRETELTETTTMLKERDKQVEKIQHDRDETNLKYFEARSVVERIFELTNKIVSSIEHEGQILSKEKQLETELDLMMETIRSREMEVLQTRRALAIKENELKMALNKLNERENEMKEMRQEMTTDADELRKLYEMVQERVGEKSIGELAIEKLELEAAQLEVEAATSALEKITEMSRELLRATSLLVEVDYDLDLSTKNIPETVSENGCLAELKTEVARLSDLTQTLVQEAGIDGDV